MLQSLCSLFLLMLLFGDGLTELRRQQSRIVGGNYAAAGQFPYQVSVEVRINIPNGPKNAEYFNLCGGGLLASKWVVTSVSCIILDKSSYRLVAGVNNLRDMSKDRQERVPEQFIVHPQYNDSELQYDFALIKVAPFRFSQYVKPVKLPSVERPKETHPSGLAEVAGWGTIDQSGEYLPFRLKYIRIMLKGDGDTQTECIKWFPNFGIPFHFCSFPENKKAPCRFDNGSPLVQNGTIQGIISKVDTPCAVKAPTIYSDVAKALPFFKEYIHE